MAKQPGDKVMLVIDRQGQRREMEVTLDVAGAAPPTPVFAAGKDVQVGPQLRITGLGNNSITVHNSQGVDEVAIEPPTRSRRAPTDEVEMLRIQVSGFEKVIQKLQGQTLLPSMDGANSFGSEGILEKLPSHSGKTSRNTAR